MICVLYAGGAYVDSVLMETYFDSEKARFLVPAYSGYGTYSTESTY